MAGECCPVMLSRNGHFGVMSANCCPPIGDQQLLAANCCPPIGDQQLLAANCWSPIVVRIAYLTPQNNSWPPIVVRIAYLTSECCTPQKKFRLRRCAPRMLPPKCCPSSKKFTLPPNCGPGHPDTRTPGHIIPPPTDNLVMISSI